MGLRLGDGIRTSRWRTAVFVGGVWQQDWVLVTGEKDEFRVSSGGFKGLVRIEQKLEFPMTASDADQSRPIRWIVCSNTNLM